jgi:hypothetical protein
MTMATQDTMPDLSFLEGLETEPTQMARVSRGRPTEPNPMEVHYMKSYQGERQYRSYRNSKRQAVRTWYGPAIQIVVDSEIAHYVERLLRRAANDTEDGGVSVQFFLSRDSDERIPIDALPGVKPRKDPKTQEPIKVKKIKKGVPIYVAFQAKERIEKPRNGETDESDNDFSGEAEDAA